MKKILIVEDDKEYREFLADELRKYSFHIDDVESPIEGIKNVSMNTYDVVISDLNLPHMSGVHFTDAVKNIAPSTVTIILTGDPDEGSELESIENNIDLYIEKSKTIPVIVGYIEKLLKENEEVLGKDVLLTSKVENISLNVGTHAVHKDDELVELTPKEYEVLKILLSNKNVVLTREYFVEKIWSEPLHEVDLRLVDSHVKNLRDKMNLVSIMTVRGYGYRWNEL